MAGGGLWGELIKQGFQNFRQGMNNLNSGFGNIATAANTGKQQFNPVNNNSGYLNTQTGGNNNGIFAQGMSNLGDMVKEKIQNKNMLGGTVDEEEENQNNGGGLGIWGNAINEQIDNNGLFDRIYGGGW